MYTIKLTHSYQWSHLPKLPAHCYSVFLSRMVTVYIFKKKIKIRFTHSERMLRFKRQCICMGRVELDETTQDIYRFIFTEFRILSKDLKKMKIREWNVWRIYWRYLWFQVNWIKTSNSSNNNKKSKWTI